MNHDMIQVDTDDDAEAVVRSLAAWLGGTQPRQNEGGRAWCCRISNALLSAIDMVAMPPHALAPYVSVEVVDDDIDEHRAMPRVVEAILAYTDWGVETVTAEDAETVVRVRDS